MPGCWSRGGRPVDGLGGIGDCPHSVGGHGDCVGHRQHHLHLHCDQQASQEQQRKARLIGLTLAMVMRVGLLCFIATIASWTQPLFELTALLPESLHSLLADATSINEVSVRDLILFGGGLFLIYQSVKEMHHLTEPEPEVASGGARAAHSFAGTLVQIAILDIVFSLDSVITAVGMVDSIPVMIAAVIVAVLAMMFFSGPVSAFVLKHPSVKVLALAFLLMIGVMLVAEASELTSTRTTSTSPWRSRYVLNC